MARRTSASDRTRSEAERKWEDGNRDRLLRNTESLLEPVGLEIGKPAGTAYWAVSLGVQPVCQGRWFRQILRRALVRLHQCPAWGFPAQGISTLERRVTKKLRETFSQACRHAISFCRISWFTSTKQCIQLLVPPWDHQFRADVRKDPSGSCLLRAGWCSHIRHADI